MAVAEVQKGDSTAYVASGAAATVLPANSTVGHTVVLAILVNSTSHFVSAVSSSIGTFTLLQNFTHGGILLDTELWICENATGAATTVTVTTGGSTNYLAQATEFSNVGSNGGGVNGTGASTAPGFTTTSVPAGGAVAAVIATGNAFTSEPSSPWVNYNTGGQWGTGTGRDTGYELVAAGGTVTATYASAAADDFGYVYVILSPAAPFAPRLPTVISQAVQRAATWCKRESGLYERPQGLIVPRAA